MTMILVTGNDGGNVITMTTVTTMSKVMMKLIVGVIIFIITIQG